MKRAYLGKSLIIGSIISVLLLGSQKLISDEVTFNWVRVLKPLSSVPVGWDPRVAITADIVDPATANRLQYLHWQKNNGDQSWINFYYNYPPPLEIGDFNAFDLAIKASFQTWTNLADSNIVFNFAGTTYKSYPSDPPWSGEDHMNIVTFVDDSSLVAGFSEGVIGKTLLTWDSGDTDGDGITTELIDCDILLNSGIVAGAGEYTWSVTEMNYDMLILDVQSVLTHEIGHLLGIAHPFGTTNRPDDNDVPLLTCPTMFASLTPAFTDNLNMRTLENYDKNCAAFLYPILTDGNDTWQTAVSVGEGEYLNFQVSGNNDLDWYVTFLERYDTIKVTIIIPNEKLGGSNPEDLDLFLCFNPSGFNPSNPTNTISVYTNAEIRYKSVFFNSPSPGYYYEAVYAHTVTQPGNYYILVKGKTTSDATPYDMFVWVSKDGDGDETSTNRTQPIPNGDGIPDAWEILYGLNPTNIDDPLDDNDEDGLIALEEYGYSTDPTNPDTDLDGMNDGWEIAHNMQVLVPDGDGDNDNDGSLNFDEYIAGTDPNDPASFFALQSIGLISQETGLGDDFFSIILNWNSAAGKSYDIYYKDSVESGFTLIEEISSAHLVINGPSFNDSGYPPYGAPNAGTMRPAPFSNGTGQRYYKIIVNPE
ncbi:MAG: hypothetical protein C4541_13180 [Candidatus Auribacter fodinae]|jgi:hypothetical protein|uniref:Peptidase M10 metallopeptidase domain-containing protein n=1 Tax=Candidatus Auribacter fodinae TaxID=2093366 RepID=A0A3A4QUX2_9BACT|nr:MAG: hypothetical protein C4541_13180 [Candidatus Auribacter fodinae]